MNSYYQILGVDKNASQEEIRRAYHALARKLHPDVNQSEEAVNIFKEVTTAYNVLSDPTQRTQYNNLQYQRSNKNKYTDNNENRNRSRSTNYRSYREQSEAYNRSAFDSPNNDNSEQEPYVSLVDVPISNLLKSGTKYFKKIFSFFKDRKNFGESLSIIEVVVTVEESIKGAEKIVQVTGEATPRKVKVSIPTGVRDGSIVRLRSRNRPRDEILVIMRIAPHPFLRIEPKGLIAEIPITIGEAIEGAQIEAPTLDRPVSFTIPPGTKSGREVCIKGRGVNLEDGTRGDLFLRFIIQPPSSLHSQNVLSLAKELDKYYHQHPRRTLGSRLI
jgi:curved DNA-binding protein